MVYDISLPLSLPLSLSDPNSLAHPFGVREESRKLMDCSSLSFSSPATFECRNFVKTRNKPGRAHEKRRDEQNQRTEGNQNRDNGKYFNVTQCSSSNNNKGSFVEAFCHLVLPTFHRAHTPSPPPLPRPLASFLRCIVSACLPAVDSSNMRLRYWHPAIYFCFFREPSKLLSLSFEKERKKKRSGIFV